MVTTVATIFNNIYMRLPHRCDMQFFLNKVWCIRGNGGYHGYLPAGRINKGFAGTGMEKTGATGRGLPAILG